MAIRPITRRTALGFLALLPLASGCGYNRIQGLKQAVDAAQGQIQTQLQRRADLIPNLVNTVKGYAAHEQEVFTRVAEARSGLVQAIQGGDAAAMATADATMNSALGRLFAVVEAYPQLKADQGFIRLQDELTGTENRIAVARGDFNTAVRAYNTYITQFPQVLTAKATGAKERSYYQATAAGVNQPPTVDFGKSPGRD
jgi:LemA protein